MVIVLVLSLVVLAVAAFLFLRAGAIERRPELRLTREHELVRQAAEYHRRRAEAAATDPPALPDARPPEAPPEGREGEAGPPPGR